MPDQNVKINVLKGLEFQGANFVTTDGLSKYKMEMPNGLEDKANIELCLLLSSEFDSEKLDFKGLDIALLIEKIAKLIIEKKSWVGAGHTFPNISEESTITIYTEMDSFLLIEPILYQKELSGMKVDENEIKYLAIIPIYKRELDFKMKNGAYSLMKRLKKNSVTEYFEMKRPISLKRKFLGL
jgi:hypothetical protein